MAKPKTAHELCLLRAVERGHIKKTKYLLNLNLIQSNDKRYFDYHLIIKALDGHADVNAKIAKLLVEKGLRVFKKSKPNQERTVLHAAVQSGRADIVIILLAKEAALDISSSDEHNKTPLHWAICMHRYSIMSLFLCKFDVKTFDERYILHYAIKKNDVDIILQLIGKGVSLKKKNEKKITPFCEALKNENFEVLDILLSHCSVKNINLNNFDDVAPVYIASYCGNLKIIKEYADSGLSVNIPLKLDNKTWLCLRKYPGFTLLHFAVQNVKLEVVEFLLSVGADVIVENKNGSTPLHIAFETKEKGFWKTWKEFEDNNSIIDLMLKANTKFKSNPINKLGLSHFHIACSRDEPTVIEHFLQLGAPINRAVKLQCHMFKQFSPLHFAAKFRCEKTVELLLKNGADVKQTDFKKMTALHIAATYSSLDVVSSLLQYGADVAAIDSHGNTPLHWAFEKKNYGILDLLLSVPNVAESNPANSKGISHFHIACTRNNVNVVKSFIESGVLVDACVPAGLQKNNDDTDWSGYSPLHFAVSHNRAKIVQLLLHKEANVEVINSKGLTALHIAYRYTYEMFGEFIKTALCDLNRHGKVVFEFKQPTGNCKVSEKNSHGVINGSVGKIKWTSNRAEHMKVLDALLNAGCDVNRTDAKGNTAVFYACAGVTKIKRVMENNLRCSPVLWAQIINDLSRELYERRKLILNHLLKLDVNLDECYKHGSILHHIASNFDKESAEMMELFLHRGANVDATNEEMLTPLHLAVLSRNKKLISVLLDYDANVNCVDPTDNSTPLLTATSKLDRHSYHYIVELLVVKGANPNARQSDGMTALHNVASREEDPHVCSVISTLIKAGADVDGRDSSGRTALHVAARMGDVDMMGVLLTNGADVSAEDDRGKVPGRFLYKILLGYLTTGSGLPFYEWRLMDMFQKHILKIVVLGLPVSGRAMSCHFKMSAELRRTEQEWIDKCEKEVRVLRDTKIHANCTLLDVIFRNENALSRLVENSRLKATLKSKTFAAKYPNYGYLVLLKYQAGVDRAKLLPVAKGVFNNLMGLHLPDVCSENICKYFNNVELRESVEMLRDELDLKMEILQSDEMQLRSRTAQKRQRVN